MKCTAIEYGLIAALIAVAAIGLMSLKAPQWCDNHRQACEATK